MALFSDDGVAPGEIGPRYSGAARIVHCKKLIYMQRFAVAVSIVFWGSTADPAG